MSKPVVDFYKKKGKVVEVDGAKDVNTVWQLTKVGIEKKLPKTIEKIELPGNPKIVFVLGGPASGKGT
jgi:adenylate kinase family enzyme